MSAGEFSGINYGVGVVRGVRSFDVDQYGRLTGVSFKRAWKPGENEAECLAGSGGFVTAAINQWITSISASYYPGGPVVPVIVPKREQSPARGPHSLDGCSHGFYAYYDGSDDYKSDARISGVVEGYGETVIGTRGFRSAKARIVALCIPRVRPPILHTGALALGCASLAGFVTAASTIPKTMWPLLPLITFVAAVILLMSTGDTGNAGGRITGEQLAKLRRNYPDVPVYRSFRRMVAAFPPDKALQPSPESDPKFWERSA